MKPKNCTTSTRKITLGIVLTHYDTGTVGKSSEL